MRSIILLSFSLVLSPAYGQHNTIAEKYAATIEGNTIKEHVYKLASREFQGRETGSEGNLAAARYIADQFKSYRIPVIPNDGDYFQDMAFSSIKWSSIKLDVNGATKEHLKDYLSIPQYFPLTEKLEINSLTFLGYGIDDPKYSDYRGKKYTGQHLLVYAGEPRNSKGNFRISGSDSLSA